MKNPAWSYSRLVDFERCPQSFYRKSVVKDVGGEVSEAMDYGKKTHKHLELRVKDKTPLPLHLRYVEKYMKALADAPGDKLTEQQMCINDKFEPTSWFGKDAWCRAIMDLAIVNGDRAALFDHKTGKMSDDFTQMKLAGAVFLLHMPEVNHLDLSYFWLKEKKFTRQTLERRHARSVWVELLPRVARYNKAHHEDMFPTRPGWGCKYCPVLDCQHNENKKR